VITRISLDLLGERTVTPPLSLRADWFNLRAHATTQPFARISKCSALPARRRRWPRVMASLCNLAITIVRLAGATAIAAALRYHARRPGPPCSGL